MVSCRQVLSWFLVSVLAGGCTETAQKVQIEEGADEVSHAEPQSDLQAEDMPPPPPTIQIPFTSDPNDSAKPAWMISCTEASFEDPWLDVRFNCPADLCMFGNPVVKDWGGEIDLSKYKKQAVGCRLEFEIDFQDVGETRVKLKGPDAEDPSENQSPDVILSNFITNKGNLVSIPIFEFDGPNYNGKYLAWTEVRQIMFDVYQCKEIQEFSIRWPLTISCED